MDPKNRRAKSERLIAKVRKAALALEGTCEKISHGEPAFFRARMFATIDDHHHGSGHVALWCRAEDGVQRAFVEASPEHFFVPPYVGAQGWIGVRLDSGLEWSVVARFIEQAWAQAAPKRAARPSRVRATPAKRAK
jgi:hypothetical protein